MTFNYYASHPGATNPENHRVQYIKENHIGLMISAEHWGNPFTNYAVDNGAWSDFVHNRPFNAERFHRTLMKIKRLSVQPDFIILPDIVQGGRSSLDLSKRYLHLTEHFPCYLAIQDGISPEMIGEHIWEQIKGVFIRGSDVWKWRYLHIWTELAHSHEKKIHVGRVGTLRDMQRCYHTGVDSADGSALIRNQKHTDIMRFLTIARNASSYLGDDIE